VTTIHVDFRFVDLDFELSSLEKHRQILEEQLTFVKEQERVRLRARLMSPELEMENAERQLAHEEVNVLVEEMLPRFFRGPYLVALWALFESGVIEIADYLAKAKQLLLRLRDIRGRDPKDQWNKYYTQIAGYPLDFTDPTWKRLEELRQVRHVLVHANGRLDLAEESARRKLNKWCGENRGLSAHFNLLIVSADYAQAAQTLVTETLSGLISRVRAEFSG
jgi:regulator of replication initiation timing